MKPTSLRLIQTAATLQRSVGAPTAPSGGADESAARAKAVDCEVLQVEVADSAAQPAAVPLASVLDAATELATLRGVRGDANDNEVLSQLPAREPARAIAPRPGTWLPSASRAQVVIAIGCVLFGLGAWQQLLVRNPPLQDLPNHMAAAHILGHLGSYPELMSNGFWKTNSALFAWLHWGGSVLGIGAAARLFALAVLAITAFAIPTFLTTFGGRRRALVGSLFAFPMVHNYFVSMGMLDFALAVPLSLLLLVMLARQRRAPSDRNSVALAVLAIATWYAHVFAVLVVGFLLVVHWASQPRGVRREWKSLGLPMAPAALLTIDSVVRHLTEPGGAMTGFVEHTQHAALWELAYNFFAEWVYGFTWLSAASVVALLGAALGLRRARSRVLFFSPVALAGLAILYCVTPYSATQWFHVNSRFLPYLWFGLLVRVPTEIPRWLARTALVAAPLYSLALGIDYVRLERERVRFTEGIAHVAPGAKLLPLLFESKGASENTHSLLHAWGHYVVERGTSAPLLFAHSRAFALMYRTPPAARLNHLVLEHFAPSMRSPAEFCTRERAAGRVVDDCAKFYHERWAAFWQTASPAFDSLLLYKPTAAAIAQLPAEYSLRWSNGDTSLYARTAAATSTADPSTLPAPTAAGIAGR